MKTFAARCAKALVFFATAHYIFFAPDAWARSCEVQRYYEPAHNGTWGVLSLVWGAPGNIIISLLWFAAAAALIISLQCKTRLASSTAPIFGAALALYIIRLIVGDVYFCRGYETNLLLQGLLERGAAILSGVFLLALPCILLGILFSSLAASAMNNCAIDESAVDTSWIRRAEILLTAVLSATFVAFGWLPRLALGLSLISSIGLLVSVLSVPMLRAQAASGRLYARGLLSAAIALGAALVLAVPLVQLTN